MVCDNQELIIRPYQALRCRSINVKVCFSSLVTQIMYKRKTNGKVGAGAAQIDISPRDRFSVKTATARYVPPVVRPRNSAGPAPSYPRGDPQSLVAVGVGGARHLGGWVPRITLHCPGQGTEWHAEWHAEWGNIAPGVHSS